MILAWNSTKNIKSFEEIEESFRLIDREETRSKKDQIGDFIIFSCFNEN